MKIGLCEKDLRGSLNETLAWMQSAGLEGFQIWKGKMDSEAMSPAGLLALAADHGLTVTSVGGGPNMVIPSKAAETIDLFKKFLDLSVELGCGIVCAESKERPDDLSEDAAWQSTVKTVRAICDHAENVGAVVAIEPAGPCFVRDHEVFMELKKRVGSDALKVNYDPANIVWAGKDVVKGVQMVGADIVHTHAKDIARVIEGAADSAEERLMDVPAGEGLVNFDTYLPALKTAGYDGWLIIEMHAGKEDRRADILKSKANLDRMLANI